MSRGGGGGSGSGSSGAVVRTMAEALRSPSKKAAASLEAAAAAAAAENAAAAAAAASATGGKQGRTKGIVGGVLAVKDAAVSRCVRFDGRGWAVARRPNLTVQALDVFVLEALIRPSEGRPRQGGEGSEGEETTPAEEGKEEEESVVLSQGGASGFCLAIQGTKAILQLNGAEAAASGEPARHVTPDGALPPAGSWFKLSAAVARDTSQGMDKVRCCGSS